MNKYQIIIPLLILYFFFGEVIAQEINVGVVAISGIAKAYKSWQPTIDYLNRNLTEYSFKLVLIEPKEMSKLELKVKNNEIDFIITPPALYADLNNLYRTTSILTLVDKSKQACFGSVLFVRSDNQSINTLHDIKNKSIAAVAKKGFAGWLVGYHLFLENKIDLYKESKDISFMGTQPKVVKSVLSGIHDLGIVRTGMLEKLSAKGEINIEDIRIINQRYVNNFPYFLSSRLYPEWAFAKMSKTPRKLAKKVAIALLSLPEGDKIALAGGYWEWTTPANYQSVHELMKKLHVGSYLEYGKITTYDYFMQNKGTVMICTAFVMGLFIFLILLRNSNQKLHIEQKAKKEALERLKVIASHDELTGLPNRTLMLEFLQRDISCAIRREHELAIMFIDLDGFKQVNDTLGHETGDNVLIETANSIKNILRKTDICARIGGDEFIVIAKEFEDNGIEVIAEKLIYEISNIHILASEKIKINASIGIVVLVPTLETKPEILIKMADKLMYKAKNQGKGRYVIQQVTLPKLKT